MNKANSWQYHPLTVDRQSQRDALIRVMIRAMQELAQRKLVPYDCYSCEQFVEKKIARHGPGLFRYEDARVEYASPEWLQAHGEGRLRLECILEVSAEDRMVSEKTVTDGAILVEMFAAELAALLSAPPPADKPSTLSKRSRPQRKYQALAPAATKKKLTKPKAPGLIQGCLFDL